MANPQIEDDQRRGTLDKTCTRSVNLPAKSGNAVYRDAACWVCSEAWSKHFEPVDDYVVWWWRAVVKRQVLDRHKQSQHNNHIVYNPEIPSTVTARHIVGQLSFLPSFRRYSEYRLSSREIINGYGECRPGVWSRSRLVRHSRSFTDNLFWRLQLIQTCVTSDGHQAMRPHLTSSVTFALAASEATGRLQTGYIGLQVAAWRNPFVHRGWLLAHRWLQTPLSQLGRC